MVSAFLQLHPGEVTIHPPQQFYAGDTWPITGECTDADGAAMDLSGATVTWLLNEFAADGTPGANKLTLTVGAGIALVENVSGDLVPGLILITITPGQSAGIAPGFYLDQLEVVDPGGQVLTQFRGRIEVLAKLPVAVSG